jgi:hypothetical protein
MHIIWWALGGLMLVWFSDVAQFHGEMEMGWYYLLFYVMIKIDWDMVFFLWSLTLQWLISLSYMETPVVEITVVPCCVVLVFCLGIWVDFSLLTYADFNSKFSHVWKPLIVTFLLIYVKCIIVGWSWSTQTKTRKEAKLGTWEGKSIANSPSIEGSLWIAIIPFSHHLQK